MTAPFDAYRDPDARKLLIWHRQEWRMIDANKAVAELRTLNHTQLAYEYRDALASVARPRVDYDPLAIGRI